MVARNQTARKAAHLPNLFGVQFVYIVMSVRTKEEIANAQHLRAEYEAAFAEWAVQVHRLQTIPPSSPAVEQAQSQADAAESVYRFTRDRLVDDMN